MKTYNKKEVIAKAKTLDKVISDEVKDLGHTAGSFEEKFITNLEKYCKLKNKLSPAKDYAFQVVGGNDLHPKAERLLKHMGFAIGDYPDLIKLVPGEEYPLIVEFLKQRQGSVYPEAVARYN
jgi:hypothetical protein